MYRKNGGGAGMLDKLLKEFLLKGYMKINVLEPQLRAAFKLTREGIHYVCIIDDTDGFLKPGMIRNVYGNVENLLAGNEKTAEYAAVKCEGISIILTNDPGHSRESLSQTDRYWLIHQPTKRLMVFDDQPGEFYEARQCAEEYLNQNGLRLMLSQLKTLYSPVNIILIVINILIFVFMELLGSTDDWLFMYNFGALNSYAVVAERQFWRILTSAFMHFGAAHLACNMISLLYLGKPLEKYLGSVRYLITYLVCAVCAGLVSTFWFWYSGDLGSISAGASGAICGVAGALAFVMLKNRKSNRQFTFLRWFIFVALVAGQGIGDSGIDNAAHIGGLISGFLFCALLTGIAYVRSKARQQ